MLYFNCDYNEGAHERIIKALTETNLEQTIGYGEDEYCRRAAEAIRAQCTGEPDVHFLVGGTQVNLTVISAALRPHQCVICAKQGHINTHEAGAIEAAGHKVVPLESADGKLSAAQVEEAVRGHYGDGAREHTTQPKLVYISNPTELGEVYTRSELEQLRAVCKQHGLYLYLDGARLGYGLCSGKNDLDIAGISELCDVFYIGGTKQGALFGEAVVISHPHLRQDFRYMIKQKGGLLAKGRLLGIQFLELFKDGLYFELSAHASEMAGLLREAFGECGYPLPVDGETNQLFVVIPNRVLEQLEKTYLYEYHQPMDAEHSMVRFCTSWATKEAHVKQLITDLKQFSK